MAKIGRERGREEETESGYKKKESGRGRIKISQRQLTIVKSHSLTPPPITRPYTRDGRRSGVTDPPLSPTKQNSLALPYFPPPVRKRAIINIEKMKNY